MGKMHLNRLMGVSLLGLTVGLTGALLPAQKAYAASSCQISGGDLFPPPKWASQFGDCRGSSCHRKHTGLDLGYNAGQTVPHPKIKIDGQITPCEILRNSRGGYVFNNKNQAVDDAQGNTVGKDNGGYGYQLFYRCGPAKGSEQITLRYSHVPRRPITNSDQILQGSSGNARGGRSGPHYHFEIVYGNRPIDPECTMYGVKPKHHTNIDGASATCKKCPAGANSGQPANLCDKTVVGSLVSHGQNCTNNKTRSVPQGASTDPKLLNNKNGQPDPNENPNTGGHGAHDGDGGHEGGPLDEATNGGGYTGDPADLDPPISPPPPPPPPPPVPPGTPGGDPELVPKTDAEVEKYTGCATDTWAAMVNQAVIETRREDIMNKRYIVKPDTAIDYGCVQYYMKTTADKAGPIFSETEDWYNRSVNILAPKPVIMMMKLGSKSLDNALAETVEYVIKSYRNQQFTHPRMSGTVPVPANAGKDTCDLMKHVWKAAKCKNFDGPQAFYTFEDLKTIEPREFPPNYKCK